MKFAKNKNTHVSMFLIIYFIKPYERWGVYFETICIIYT